MQRIFVLDDSPERHAAFRNWLSSPNIFLSIASDFASAISTVEGEGPFDTWFLDHDLNEFESCSKIADGYGFRELTGLDFVRTVISTLPKEKRPKLVIVHSWSDTGAKAMVDALVEAGVTVRSREFQS